MPRRVSSRLPSNVIQRQRYGLMRSLGVPPQAARHGCTGGARFALAMRQHGHDPDAYPALAAIKRGGDPLGRGLAKARACR